MSKYGIESRKAISWFGTIANINSAYKKILNSKAHRALFRIAPTKIHGIKINVARMIEPVLLLSLLSIADNKFKAVIFK